MKKGEIINVWLLLSVLIMALVSAFLFLVWTGALHWAEPQLKETAATAGVVLTKRYFS